MASSTVCCVYSIYLSVCLYSILSILSIYLSVYQIISEQPNRLLRVSRLVRVCLYPITIASERLYICIQHVFVPVCDYMCRNGEVRQALLVYNKVTENHSGVNYPPKTLPADQILPIVETTDLMRSLKPSFHQYLSFPPL